MKLVTCAFSIVASASVLALAAPALAQQPAAGSKAARCAAMRDAFARHPAPNPEVQARRDQRLRDCEAGKEGSDQSPDADQGDQSGHETDASGSQPAAGAAGSGGVSLRAPAASAVEALPAAPAGAAGPARMASPGALAGVAPTFNNLRFVVATGDDDLRNDTTAWVEVVPSSSGAAQRCALKAAGAPTWDNGSNHDVQCTLNSRMTLDELRSAKLLLEHDGSPNQDGGLDSGKGYDNWKVNEIQVMVVDDGGRSQCLVDAKGNPQLVALTGDNHKFLLSAASGGTCARMSINP
jgi:hypothetical protein